MGAVSRTARVASPPPQASGRICAIR